MKTRYCMTIALVCALTMGCQKAKKTEHDALGDFARSVLTAGQAKDSETFVNKLSMNSVADLNAMVAVLKKVNPEEKFEDGEKKPTDAEIRKETVANVRLFMKSYADVFDGKLSSVASVHDSSIRGANVYAMIIWSKHNDGKFRGILIDSVWKNEDGTFKVITWTQLSGYEASRGAIKRKAILVRDTAEACDFPESITYETTLTDPD